MAANRIQIEVTMNGIYSFVAPAYGYGTEERYIYNMTDESGKVYVWKTTTLMGIDEEDAESLITRNGRPVVFHKINKGDKFVITASVKGEGEYKGTPQTILTRVKVKQLLSKAETWEDIQARREAEKKAKAQEQIDSIQDGDIIWTMPYRQYKEHYNDCETIIGSYNKYEEENRNRYRNFLPATIDVIIRKGRLKNSGVRGEHYSGYGLENQDGKQVVYRAVKEENAIRRAEKEFGGEWKCVKIFRY